MGSLADAEATVDPDDAPASPRRVARREHHFVGTRIVVRTGSSTSDPKLEAFADQLVTQLRHAPFRPAPERWPCTLVDTESTMQWGLTSGNDNAGRRSVPVSTPVKERETMGNDGHH